MIFGGEEEEQGKKEREREKRERVYRQGCRGHQCKLVHGERHAWFGPKQKKKMNNNV